MYIRIKATNNKMHTSSGERVEDEYNHLRQQHRAIEYLILKNNMYWPHSRMFLWLHIQEIKAAGGNVRHTVLTISWIYRHKTKHQLSRYMLRRYYLIFIIICWDPDLFSAMFLSSSRCIYFPFYPLWKIWYCLIFARLSWRQNSLADTLTNIN